MSRHPDSITPRTSSMQVKRKKAKGKKGRLDASYFLLSTFHSCLSSAMLLAVLSLLLQGAQGATRDANVPADTNAVEKASLVVHMDQKSPYLVPRFITGKFCEHLYFNVTNGMDAQILKNPTFADYPFSTGETSPDGIATFHYRQEDI